MVLEEYVFHLFWFCDKLSWHSLTCCLLPSTSDIRPEQAIKMDAPVVKAWKKSSTLTKYSYYVMLFFFLLFIFGFRHLRYWNCECSGYYLLDPYRTYVSLSCFFASFFLASILLTCQSQECSLDVKPPGHKTITVDFARNQLHSTQATKTDKAGNFLSVDTSKYQPPRKKKGKHGAYRGPDENGEYRSYALKFKKSTSDEGEEDVADGDFSDLSDYLSWEEGEGLYVLHMRKFGLTHSKTRIRSMISKVDSYIKRRRQKLVLRESVPVSWKGIVCLVFGLLGLTLTLLIGQFWDEPQKRQGGPGARRTPSRRAPVEQRKRLSHSMGSRPGKFSAGLQYQKKN